jgi:hypothetical protein
MGAPLSVELWNPDPELSGISSERLPTASLAVALLRWHFHLLATTSMSQLLCFDGAFTSVLALLALFRSCSLLLAFSPAAG